MHKRCILLLSGFVQLDKCIALIGFREERLRFWSDPDTELKLAKDTGISIFRMGIDWTRIMPQEPVNGLKDAVSLMLL